jgi:HipA-like C-terminal domain
MSNQIVSIPLDAREDTEQLGSKPKFWVLLDKKRWLFKETRPNTGEDWAEKAAAEVAKAIGIKAASVELADYAGRRGCISLNFVDVAAGEALVHGNEILAMRVTGYDKGKHFRQSDHTLENIEAAIRGLFPVGHADEILTELASYMVLDALIGNTDRHHENWGLLLSLQSETKLLTLSVAPSFDHASSLGRELLDERRGELLAADRVSWYVNKGRGGMFRGSNEKHGENPLRFVQVAARAYPRFFSPALERAAALQADDVHRIFDQLPLERASENAKKFAEAMIFYAQASLHEILK